MVLNRRCFTLSMLAAAACRTDAEAAAPSPAEPALRDLPSDPPKVEPLLKTDAEWHALLGIDAYHVLREKGTERAFTGAYHANHAAGRYRCAACGLTLFSSDDKFDSGTGWPSFTRPIAPDRIADTADKTYGMVRTEVSCARCGGHQGHVFDDGPRPTGLRYCNNGVALRFVPATDELPPLRS